MAISDPPALVSKLLRTDIISNIRRSLAILEALKGHSPPLSHVDGLRSLGAQVTSKRFANTIKQDRFKWLWTVSSHTAVVIRVSLCDQNVFQE